jgi:hypothetical protein
VDPPDQRVLDTIRLMLDDGEPISLAAVARAANVSTWLVYAEGVREHVQAAIQRQEKTPVTAVPQGRRAGPTSLHADLAMARGEIKEHLGHQLGQISNRSLTERINELTQANRKLEHELPNSGHSPITSRSLSETWQRPAPACGR